MSRIREFFERNTIAVFFCYGLSFFLLGLAVRFFLTRVRKVFRPAAEPRLMHPNRTTLLAQADALEAERRVSRKMEQLNEELSLTARELALLLDLSNLLATPMPLPARLQEVLNKIVTTLDFPDAGMILLAKREHEGLNGQVSTGLLTSATGPDLRYAMALDLGKRCVAKGLAMCRHLDGQVIRFSIEDVVGQHKCRQHESPLSMIALPLNVQQRVIGSIVLAQPEFAAKPVTVDEFCLITGIAQQLGLSIENALLYQEAQKREKLLGELLHQVVTAQEAERERIARELHDSTGQSLTAMTLGLGGVEAMLANKFPAVAAQIRELQSFGSNALGELRRTISDLRPPQLNDLGLIDALQWYIQTFEKRHAVHTQFAVEGERARLPREYETVLFRITQEALTNIAKHADAAKVTVRLELRPTYVQLSVIDDGRGFDPEKVLAEEGQPFGWGLLGIRERCLLLGGQYKIDSTPGCGTCVTVKIPLVEALRDVENKATAC